MTKAALNKNGTHFISKLDLNEQTNKLLLLEHYFL
jgi:hypothetical protein